MRRDKGVGRLRLIVMAARHLNAPNVRASTIARSAAIANLQQTWLRIAEPRKHLSGITDSSPLPSHSHAPTHPRTHANVCPDCTPKLPMCHSTKGANHDFIVAASCVFAWSKKNYRRPTPLPGILALPDQTKFNFEHLILIKLTLNKNNPSESLK